MRDQAFEDLFTEEFDVCASVAGRICGSIALGEDVAMDAFARAWASWRRIRLYRRPGAWLMRVTVNRAIDVARRATPDVRPTIVPDLADQVVSSIDLATALESLSPRQREVVALRYLIGLSEDEVAQPLGVSRGSVKTHANRGLNGLRGGLSATSEGGKGDATR